MQECGDVHGTNFPHRAPKTSESVMFIRFMSSCDSLTYLLWFLICLLMQRTMAFAVSIAEKIVTFLRQAENTRRQAMALLLLVLLLLAAAAFYVTRLRFW